MSRAFPSDRAGLKAMAAVSRRLFHSPVTRGKRCLWDRRSGAGTVMLDGVIFLSSVGVSLVLGGCAGWALARANPPPEPYNTAQTPEAEAYRAARGLPPGAPIPRREYWRAVQQGTITPEPWIKTPTERRC
jgi:hypothetical protein